MRPVLSFNSVFCQDIWGSLTREGLLNIRSTIPVDLFPTFLFTAADFVGIIVKATLGFVLAAKRRRRSKRAGALVRLRRHGARTLLPGIFLSNVRSLSNKLDELQLLVWKNRDFRSSSVLCFTETWLSELIPDSVLQLAGFKLLRADRASLPSGRTKGGGIRAIPCKGHPYHRKKVVPTQI